MFVTSKFVRLILVGSITIGFLTNCTKRPGNVVEVTVEVSGGGDTYTGRSVQMVGCRKADPLWGNMDVGGCQVFGEAVVVDMGRKGYLFMPFAAPKRYNYEGYVKSLFGPRQNESAAEWDVPPEAAPLFVRFDDQSNSRSVFEVTPDNIGNGLKISRIHVAVTQSAPTEDVIEKILPWVGTQAPAAYLNGRGPAESTGLSAELQIYDFKRAVNQ